MAGAAVKKATETLVKAAQQASVQVEEEGAGAFGPSVSDGWGCGSNVFISLSLSLSPSFSTGKGWCNEGLAQGA